jgi:hypothetical protein
MTQAFPAPPTLAPCTASTPPPLPQRWQAVTLLTPWESAQLLVANATCDATMDAMRVTIYGLEYGYADLLFTGGAAYLLRSASIGGPADRAYGPIATDAVVPAPGWLSAKVACQGIADVLETSSSWWTGETTCQNSYQNGPPPPTPSKISNTFNFRQDTGAPWRMVFVNPSNDYQLPVLGAYPIVHIPTFESVEQTDLHELKALIGGAIPVDGNVAVSTADDVEQLLLGSVERMTDADGAACRKSIATLIPGLSPAQGKGAAPFWPDRMFLTSFSTPTPGPAPYPTQVFYDWTIKRMLTRLWLPGGRYEDAILDESTTHLVIRNPDGSHVCVKTLPVGLVKPHWAGDDAGFCRAVVTNNPSLSPDRTTNICVLPSRPGQVFWTWYTSDDVPVMFVEVPQACDVVLLLTDYDDWDPNPGPFDPGLFVVPPDCLLAPLTPPTG